MTTHLSDELANVNGGDLQSLGNGSLTAYRLRGSRAKFTCDGASEVVADTLSLGYRRGGDRVIGFLISASSNMSAASIAIGNAGTPAKYKAAAALPNATSVFVVCPSTALDDDPLADREELLATISGATIPAGTLVIETIYGAR